MITTKIFTNELDLDRYLNSLTLSFEITFQTVIKSSPIRSENLFIVQVRTP